MKLVVNQCTALQGAAILAAFARWRRHYYLLENDWLGALNADRTAWVYERAAAFLVPAINDYRPEPKLEDYEPQEPEIEPLPIVPVGKPRPELVYEETCGYVS
jgi:hypothetical protein